MHLKKARLHVAQEKIIAYLLNTLHPEGGTKAYFFLQCGFRAEAWKTFARCLIQHGAQYPVAKEEDTPFGKKYVIEGLLKTSLHDDPLVRTVWFLSNGEENIKLVTAYPFRT